MLDGLNLNIGLEAGNGNRKSGPTWRTSSSSAAARRAGRRRSTPRADLRPLLITGNEMGGQIALTTEVENFPGFESITGPELVERMQSQAERFDTEVLIDYVTEIDVNGPPFTVTTANERVFKTKSIIVATGASPRRARRAQRGAAHRSRRQLLRDVRRLLLPRQGYRRGGRRRQRAARGPVPDQVRLESAHRPSPRPVARQRDPPTPGAREPEDRVRVEFGRRKHQRRAQGRIDHAQERRHRRNSETPTDGVFVYVGHLPNNQLFEGKLAMDEEGYLVTDKLMRTSVPGIFAAGEIQDHRFKQAATSAGQGVARRRSRSRSSWPTWKIAPIRACRADAPTRRCGLNRRRPRVRASLSFRGFENPSPLCLISMPLSHVRLETYMRRRRDAAEVEELRSSLFFIRMIRSASSITQAAAAG